jgi:hypothetical protein
MQEAASLSINYTGMNGPQIRDAIRRAKASRDRQLPRLVSEGVSQYQKLYDAAEALGLVVSEDVEVSDLKALIETRLDEIFQAKGFGDGITIQYAADAPLAHRGRIARIWRTSVRWAQDMPYISLHMEGMDQARPYFAHHAALYATVVG